MSRKIITEHCSTHTYLQCVHDHLALSFPDPLSSALFTYNVKNSDSHYVFIRPTSEL
jgi:hypothetical protein